MQFKIKGTALSVGDKLVGPWAGGILAVGVTGLWETPGKGDNIAEFGLSALLHQVFPEGKINPAKLPKGWTHVKAEAAAAPTKKKKTA